MSPAGSGVKATVIVFTSGRVSSHGREGSEYRQEVGDAILRQR